MAKLQDKDIDRLCKRIKAVRKKKGLTQEQLSERMGIDDGSYRRIEGARMNPSFLTLKSLCDALEMSLEEFFSEY